MLIKQNPTACDSTRSGDNSAGADCNFNKYGTHYFLLNSNCAPHND
jgi:hypothetical protein